MARCTNGQVEQALSQYLTAVNQRWRIEKAVLFGSRARDDYMLESDVDLVLVSRDFAGIPFRTRCADALEDWSGDVDLEVFCYTPEEFERKRQDPGTVQQAASEGRELALPAS